MARRTAAPEPRDVREFNTAADIHHAMTRINRRIEAIRGLAAIPYDSNRVSNEEHAVRDTLREVFGSSSPHYHRFEYFKIDQSPAVLVSDYGYRGDSPYTQQHLAAHIPGAITRLQGPLAYLQERLDELTEPTVAPRAALAGRSLHPAIGNAATQRFNGGHHADAVFAAAKTLVEGVRKKSGLTEFDGADLMRRAFSVNSPVLRFNDLKDKSDRDEQEGMMHLFEGATQAVRNPGAHVPEVQMTPERALQWLELLSLLADRLDEAR